MSVFQLRVFVSLQLKSEILLNNSSSSVKTDFLFVFSVLTRLTNAFSYWNIIKEHVLVNIRAALPESDISRSTRRALLTAQLNPGGVCSFRNPIKRVFVSYERAHLKFTSWLFWENLSTLKLGWELLSLGNNTLLWLKVLHLRLWVLSNYSLNCIHFKLKVFLMETVIDRSARNFHTSTRFLCAYWNNSSLGAGQSSWGWTKSDPI